jgi:hypothetical protein
MEQLQKTLKKEPTEYTVIALLVIFILFNIQVPQILAELIDNVAGRVIVIMIALALFFMHPILGAVALIAAYELIRRSEKKTGTYQMRHFIPSQAHKDRHLSAMNQFPVTLEEEMVHKMVPIVREGPNVPPSYKPVLSELHSAAML